MTCDKCKAKMSVLFHQHGAHGTTKWWSCWRCGYLMFIEGLTWSGKLAPMKKEIDL